SSVLKELGIVDETIAEPSGGAHRDPDAAATLIKEYLLAELPRLSATPTGTLLDQRYQRLMSYGNHEVAN
ncbi:MAG: acetyl-CoA carboxylase carboxyl transferase subunit alpha, partial [Pseudomonadales bacterium]|nr:acetyl-CoA carboxylase carboxyl transferase subunit alpha [Pseudomonadales bacterium]